MASVTKHFIARHGIAVGTAPTTVISDSGAATFTNLSISGSLQTAFNLNSQILTNANIDSGTIDGVTIATSNITVGTTKTLDISAGTLTLANDQISGDKIHGGTISGSVSITDPYIATLYAQAATGGILTLRSNSTNTTTGYINIPMTTVSTTIGTGALVVAGGLGVTGQSTLSDVVVTGNLTVNGTTTTFNATTVTVDDPVITLGGDTAAASDDNKDRGVEFKWHTGAVARTGYFGFSDATGKFTFIPDATNTGEVFTGTKGTLDVYLSASDLTTGTIATGILGNSSLYVGSTAIALNQGTGTLTTLAGLTSVTSTTFVGALTGNATTCTTASATTAALTAGTYLTSAGTFNGSAARTFAVDATNLNTASKVVARDVNGDFAARIITATTFTGALSGNATSASSVGSSITFNNSGTGEASGGTYNGSAAKTISHNSIGAVPLSGASYIQSTGLSSTWGVTNGTLTGGFNTIMGVAGNATWLVSGTGGGVFKGGVQLLDGGTAMRFYTGADYFMFEANVLTLNAGGYKTINNTITSTYGSNTLGGLITVDTTGQFDVQVGGASRLLITSTQVAFGGTKAIKVPVGTTAERPTGAAGMIRYDSSTFRFEGYNSFGWSPLTPLINDTVVNQDFYPQFNDNDNPHNTYISSTKLIFNPSTGTLSATNFTSLSDARFKKNVEDLNDGVETINKLRAVGFDWIETGRGSFGVIAQELEKILPELVEENKVAKSVNYTGIIAFLIKSVQELDARVKELEAK